MLTNHHALPLRRLLENEQLLALANPGRIFAAAVESIIIVGQRDNSAKRPIRIFDDITPGATPASLPAAQLTTTAGTWRLVPGDERRDLDRLQRLGELAQITRGVECGKHDPAIYPAPRPGAYPLLRGADVRRYQVAFSGYFLLREGEQRRYKPLALQAAPKLLVRRVANDLIAALDTEGHHALNTLYMLFLYPGCPYAPEYLCAVLNSRPLNSYFHQHYLNDDALFPYLRQEQLAALPIAVPTPNQHMHIVGLVRRLHAIPATSLDHSTLKEELEAMVSQIYG